MIQNTTWILKTAQAIGISAVVILLLSPLMNQVIGDGNQNSGCLITLGLWDFRPWDVMTKVR